MKKPRRGAFLAQPGRLLLRAGVEPDERVQGAETQGACEHRHNTDEANPLPSELDRAQQGKQDGGKADDDTEDLIDTTDIFGEHGIFPFLVVERLKHKYGLDASSFFGLLEGCHGVSGVHELGPAAHVNDDGKGFGHFLLGGAEAHEGLGVKA